MLKLHEAKFLRSRNRGDVQACASMGHRCDAQGANIIGDRIEGDLTRAQVGQRAGRQLFVRAGRGVAHLFVFERFVHVARSGALPVCSRRPRGRYMGRKLCVDARSVKPNRHTTRCRRRHALLSRAARDDPLQ